MIQFIIKKSPTFLCLTVALSLMACSDYSANPVEGDGSSAKANENVILGNKDNGTASGSSSNSSSGSSSSTSSSSGNANQGKNDNGTNAEEVAINSVVRFLPSEQLGLLNDTPFAYIQRSVSANANASVQSFKSSIENANKAPVELGSPYTVNSGAKLIFRSSLDANAVDIDILTGYFQSSDYDVKDINVSSDGKHLVFAAHGPKDHPHDNTWNIYELGFKSGLMRRIIKDDAVANAGQDTSPTYALDGTIVFSSDRLAGDPKAPIVYCDSVGPSEKPSLLHSMSNAGENIVQLTYGISHDLKTTTMKDGRISFVRWLKSYERAPQCAEQTPPSSDPDTSTDANIETLLSGNHPSGLSSPEAWSADKICAYTQSSAFGPVIASNNYTLLRMNADGSEINQLYEKVSTSASDEEFLSVGKLVQGENGKLVALLKHEYSPFSGGNVLELQKPGSGTGSAVFANLAPKALTAKESNLYPDQLSANGWYSAVWPYRDGSSRFLVSWAQCLTTKGGVSSFCRDGETGVDTDVRYGIWVYDPASDSRLPIVREKRDVVYSELAIGQPHVGEDLPFPAFAAKYVDDAQLSRIASTDTSRAFPVMLRDFRQEHPDFEIDGGVVDYGIVAATLGNDNKPVYARATGSSPTTSGAINFNQWYNAIAGVNVEVPQIFELTREPDSSLWTYSNSSFFPLDGLGWDAISTPESEVYDYPSNYIHNYHFTLETHLEFDYLGGEEFTFRGDDDLWVFINGKLVIDIGGIHAPLERSIALDELAEELGIQIGKRYSFDLFFAERHLVQSNFRFQTSINLECVYIEQ